MDWNVGKGQKEGIRCPESFSEELISVLLVKMSQINTENDKKPYFF